MGAIEETALRAEQASGKCSGCSLPLPLRLPAAHEQALQWECTGCGARYRGVLLESLSSHFRRNVRLVESRRESRRPQPSGLAAGLASEQPSPISIAFPDHTAVRSELQTASSRQLDAEISRARSLLVRLQGKPFAEGIRKHGDRPYEGRPSRGFVSS